MKEELFIIPPNSGTNNMFWDFYDQAEHRAVLVDDYEGKWYWPTMLQICDRYEIRAQTRSGPPVVFFPEYLIFTSNRDPRDWYPYESFPTLQRRILKIIHFPAQISKKKKKKVFIDFEKYAKEKIQEEEKELQEEELQEEKICEG